MRTIWERYVVFETLKVFALFLGCFLGLFIAIDYSIHMQRFLHSQAIRVPDIALYYGLQFIKRANLLVPLSLLVATIRVLTSLSASRELLALQAGGVSLKRILRPLIILGVIAALFNIYNAEFLLPKATTFIDNFSASHLKPPSEKRNARLRVVDLKDGSRLAFQKFDPKTTTFHDLFWIRSTDDIWRIKTLTLDAKQPKEAPTGYFVDHISRGSDGGLHKTTSYSAIRLEPLKAGAYLQHKVARSLENSAPHSIIRSLRKEANPDSSHYNEMLSILTAKCAFPFLSPLVVLSAAPLCARFRRHTSYFLHYALGIFGFIAFFVLLNAASILGQNQVMSPVAAIIAPLALAYGWAIWKFSKL